jgi:hypothetical protein
MSDDYNYARTFRSRRRLTEHREWYFDWAVFGSEKVPNVPPCVLGHPPCWDERGVL